MKRVGGERARSADAAWLGMERPENLLVVTGVLRFGGPLDVEALRARVQHDLVEPYPRLAQVLRPGRLLPWRYRWWPAGPVDLTWHVVETDGGTACDDAGLEQLAGDLMGEPLHPDRPAWQLHVVHLTGGRSALVARFHHSLADGMALAAVLLRLTGQGTAPTAPATPPRRPSDRGGAQARAVGSMVTTVVRLLLTLGEPPTRLRGRLGTRKLLALSRSHDLADVKATAGAHGARVNDVLLAAAAGGLRTVLREAGGPVLDVRALVPVDLRGGVPVPRDLGNRFGVLIARLPVGTDGAAARLRAVADASARSRGSAQAGGTYLLLRLVGAFPRAVRTLAVAVLEESVSVVVTNVPGPRTGLAVDGTALDSVSFWAPTAGRIGVGISLFSYAGAVTIGVAVDARLGLDPQRVAAAIDTELDVLRRATPES